jgi:hypothetical protein
MHGCFPRMAAIAPTLNDNGIPFTRVLRERKSAV